MSAVMKIEIISACQRYFPFLNFKVHIHLDSYSNNLIFLEIHSIMIIYYTKNGFLILWEVFEEEC